MISVIIVEDELASQYFIKKLIEENFPQLNIIGIYNNVATAIFEITRLKPNLVFLDIQIKGGTGFDIINSFEKRFFEVIFITAYGNYAIQAIKAEAIDYILKPITTTEFLASVNKALQKLSHNELTQKSNSSRISIQTKNEIILLETNLIHYLEADGTYTFIHTNDKRYLSSINIGAYEPLLDSSVFFRTHHSFIINMKLVESYKKGRNGEVIMISGKKIPVAQRRVKEFLLRLK